MPSHSTGHVDPFPSLALVRFGTFELDLESRDLRKQGRRIRLADQPFQVLRVLLQRAGRVVTREELQHELWADDTFVDFDVGLNSAIRKLRDALGDSAENPTFIETIPRRGYRFIAPLNGVGSDEGGEAETQTGRVAIGASLRNNAAVEPRVRDATVPHDTNANVIAEPYSRVNAFGRLGRCMQLIRSRAKSFRFAAIVLLVLAVAMIGAVGWNRRRAAVPPENPLRSAGAEAAINPAAYDAYVKGLRAEGQETYEGFRTAVDYFEQAIREQPDFARAYAALGLAQLQFLYVGPLSPRETIPKAEAAARKALELDPQLAEAHRVLATILTDFYWRWEAGDQEFQRAHELGGVHAGSTDSWMPLASLIRHGRFDDAIAEAKRRRSVDPQSLDPNLNLARAYRAAGLYDQAAAVIRRVIEVGPRRPRLHFQLGATLVMMGRLDDAIGELDMAVTSSQGNPRFKAYLGYAYAVAERPLDSRKILDDLESLSQQQYVSSFGLALIHDALGEKELALASFDRAYQDRAVEFAQWSDLFPPFKNIASEPRFQALMRRIGPLP